MITLVLLALVAVCCAAVVFTALVQLLCVELLRARPRQQRVVEFLRENLLLSLSISAEDGARAFSFFKQLFLILLSFSVLLLAAWWGRDEQGHLLLPSWLWLETLLAVLLLALITSYAIPQFLYRRNRIGWLVHVGSLVRAAVLFLRPFHSFRQFFEALTVFQEPPKTSQEEGTPEEIEALITAGEEARLFAAEDRRLIESVIAFNDKTIREVMTPRPFVVWVDAEQTLEDLSRIFREQRFSRYPVCRGNLDEVLGFVHIVDLLMEPPEKWPLIKVRDKMRPLEFVPETRRIYEELHDMQQDRTHMSIVVDEYGQTAGIVTMEDLLEEIFGEIRDELEPDGDECVKLPDGSLVARGNADLDYLRHYFEVEFDDGTESTTIGGLVSEWAGYVPARGEVVARNDLRMEVLESNKRQVLRVRVWGPPRKQPAPKERAS